MSKQVANITNFSGGLNNKTNPRDLEDNQFQDLNTISIETPGKIKLMGAMNNVTNKTNNGIAGATLNHGNGLMYLKTDRDLGSLTEQSTESLFINDKAAKTIKVFDYTDNAYEVGEAISLQVTGGTAVSSEVDYIPIDGNVMISPHTPFNTNNVCKWYGYIKKDYNLGLLNSGTNLDNIKHSYNGYYVQDMFVAPNRGSDHVSGAPLFNYAFDKEVKTGRYGENRKSEIVLNPGTPTIAFNSTVVDGATPNKNAINNSYESIRSELDNHADYSSHFGSMRMYAWFNMTVTQADLGLGDIKISGIGDTSTVDGTFSGYSLFASNVYDDEESYPVHLGAIKAPLFSGGYTRELYFALIGRLPSNPRQTGINIYFSETNTESVTNVFNLRFGTKYLFCEINFEKGLRMGGSDNYSPFGSPLYNDTTSLNADSSASTEFNYLYPLNYLSSGDNKLRGAEVLSFQRMYTEPWIQKNPNIIGKPGTGWKTSTVINRKSYIGNVSYSNEMNTGLIESQDTVFKSYVNQFGYFEYDRRLEVEINDGDNIVKLASLNGRLFEFKTKSLYIINLTRDIEYLEAELHYKGVEKDYHVLNGDTFIAWFNRYGVFLYDGQQIRELLLDQKGQERLKDWKDTYYHDDAIIGYEPHSKSIIITNKSNQSVLSFDIKSTAWTYGTKRTTNLSGTNFINNSDGELICYNAYSGNTDTGIDLRFNIASNGTQIAIEGSSNPWQPGQILLLDNEKVTVGAQPNSNYGAGITWITVSRASGGTSAAAHDANTSIFKVDVAGISLSKWNNSPSKLTGTHNIDEMALKTKDFTLGDPSIDKKIISVYLNYKNGNGVTLYGFTDGVEEKLADLEGSLETSYKTLKLNLRTIKTEFDDSKAFDSIKSFGLRLDGEDIETDFEINDIQIVFRPKALK